jgi:hypothetical protein
MIIQTSHYDAYNNIHFLTFKDQKGRVIEYRVTMWRGYRIDDTHHGRASYYPPSKYYKRKVPA